MPISKEIEKLIKRSSNPKLIEDSFEFAKEAYKDKFRISGENYIEHASRVALMLDRINLDPATIAFALLHDIADDIPESARKIEMNEIRKKFGGDIAALIEKISKLSRVRYLLAVGVKEKKTITREKFENLRKMFLALSGDLRVVLIELTSRLDGLKFLHYLPEDKQKLFARETLQIFVPIASRLGLSELRRSLEDDAFRFLFPNKFKWIKDNIQKQHEEGEKYLKKFIPLLKKFLKKERVKVLDINYRVKSYWSTYRKLAKYDMNFDKVHDLIALRIITPDITNCYRVLGAVHKHFKPISGEINDYIAKPKPNGYRSLHTTIFTNEGKAMEIQIRTEEMQREAEYGICAHWSYKEDINLKKEGQRFEWAKNIPEFLKNFRIDFFENQVFCFTPKGDIIVLPKGSTPVDFAYAVHSNIGDHCESAKIGDKIVPLNHTLENGDVVEIKTSKNKNPSGDWLKFVKTPLARSNIKKFIGQDKSGFKFPFSGIIRRGIEAIAGVSKKRKEQKQAIKTGNVRKIHIAGQKGMLVHIAKCCNPKPGDKVMAYISQHRAAVLHKASCKNFIDLSKKFPTKIVDAFW